MRDVTRIHNEGWGRSDLRGFEPEPEAGTPMSSANHRHERVGEEIAHEINAMLAGELKDPRLECSVVVSEVRVQPDMKHARVFISVRGTNKEQTDVIKALDHACGFIRSELVERLQLRRVPELHFTLDHSQEYSERIDQLLKEMKKNKPATS
jgi:ribosome-binding factor A